MIPPFILSPDTVQKAPLWAKGFLFVASIVCWGLVIWVIIQIVKNTKRKGGM